MILIGQYDSPFVRRVAIALRPYGLPFGHRRGRPLAMSTRAAKIFGPPGSPIHRQLRAFRENAGQTCGEGMSESICQVNAAC
jgi:hypothetical protein